MASKIAPRFITSLLGDFSTGVYKALLIDNTYSFDAADDFVSDVVADEIDDATRQTLASKTITEVPLNSFLVNQADHAIGDTTVTIDGGTGIPFPGDTFSLGASTQILEVVSYAGGDLEYQPPAAAAAANDAAVTFNLTGHLVLDAADLSFSGVTGNQEDIGGIWIYREVTDDTDSYLMTFLDIDDIDLGTVDSTVVSVTLPAGGFFAVMY